MAGPSRRSFLVGSAAAALLGTGGLVGCAPSAAHARITLAKWVEERKSPYLIGHRGLGGVLPEHTLESYLGALDQGGECLEISVIVSSDGVLYCHHDLSLDRTTTEAGSTRQSSQLLDAARVSVPRLGPGWQGESGPRIPRLEDVLKQVGNRAVLCIEAKDDRAFGLLIDLIRKMNLSDSVMLKISFTSVRVAQARAAGFAVFDYLGNSDVATPENIRRAASSLNPKRDCLVIPSFNEQGLLPAEVVRAAVDTGIPTWIFPIHRRSELAYFSDLGAQGLIAADLGYLSGREPVRAKDAWADGKLRSGELTREPYSESFALGWRDSALVLKALDQPAFVCFGGYAPVSLASYRISFETRIAKPWGELSQGASIAFCRADDSYYAHRQGAGSGYHGLLRANGSVELYAHLDGSPDGKQLGKAPAGSPMGTQWTKLVVEVDAETIRFGHPNRLIEVSDTSFRGAYFHIGRTSNDGELELRNLEVTNL